MSNPFLLSKNVGPSDYGAARHLFVRARAADRISRGAIAPRRTPSHDERAFASNVISQ